MSNPKDPRVSRTLGEPPVPIGFDLPAEDRSLPVDRLRRVGATDDVIGYLQAVWDSLDADGRTDWLAELDVSTDTELAEELVDIAVDDLPDPADAAAAWAEGPVDGEELERPDDAEPSTWVPTVDETTGEQPSAVAGYVQHEGGGWYSVWVDGENITGDSTVRGRDAAEELLDDHLRG